MDPPVAAAGDALAGTMHRGVHPCPFLTGSGPCPTRAVEGDSVTRAKQQRDSDSFPSHGCRVDSNWRFSTASQLRIWWYHPPF